MRKIDNSYQLDNYWEGNDPASIMLHTTYGGRTIDGVYDTLKTRGLSYNFVISWGNIYCLVDHTNSAWHAGVTDNMNIRSQVFYEDRNPNKHSVGIAFDYPQGNYNLRDEDIDAAVWLIKWLGQKTGVRYNADNIFYHKEVTSYKPVEVKNYREQVLEALVGDKDDKDVGEKRILELTLQLLKLRLKLLTKRLAWLKST